MAKSNANSAVSSLALPSRASMDCETVDVATRGGGSPDRDGTAVRVPPTPFCAAAARVRARDAAVGVFSVDASGSRSLHPLSRSRAPTVGPRPVYFAVYLF